MLRATIICSLLATALSPVAFKAVAHAQQSRQSGQICQAYQSNGVGVYALVGQYARLLNVDLAGTVDLAKTPFFPGKTVTLVQNPPSGYWRVDGYPQWQSFHDGATPTATTNTIDIRFGQSAGIYPGQTNVPKGVLHLYAVSRKQSFDTSSFTITICGQPKSTQTCAKLHVDRIVPASQIPLNFPTTPLVSVTSSNITVAAFAGKASQTGNIPNPTTNGVVKTIKFTTALNNRDVAFFSVPQTYPASHPLDTWRAQGGQPYLKVGSQVTPGDYISPVNSWAGVPGVADTPAHGNVSGDIEICAQ
jgi:hypothetical protein